MWVTGNPSGVTSWKGGSIIIRRPHIVRVLLCCIPVVWQHDVRRRVFTWKCVFPGDVARTIEHESTVMSPKPELRRNARGVVLPLYRGCRYSPYSGCSFFFYISRNCGLIVLRVERCSTIGRKEIASGSGIAIYHRRQQRHYHCALHPTLYSTSFNVDHVLPPEQHPTSCTVRAYVFVPVSYVDMKHGTDTVTRWNTTRSRRKENSSMCDCCWTVGAKYSWAWEVGDGAGSTNCYILREFRKSMKLSGMPRSRYFTLSRAQSPSFPVVATVAVGLVVAPRFIYMSEVMCFLSHLAHPVFGIILAPMNCRRGWHDPLLSWPRIWW